LPLSLGVDFPRFLYDLMVHQTQHPQVKYPTGIRSRNFVLDAFNLFTGVRNLRWNRIGTWSGDLVDFLTQPARWLTGKERSDSFVRDDLSPAVGECTLLVRSFSQKLTRTRTPDIKRRASEQTA
jgi:hypothetical protein